MTRARAALEAAVLAAVFTGGVYGFISGCTAQQRHAIVPAIDAVQCRLEASRAIADKLDSGSVTTDDVEAFKAALAGCPDFPARATPPARGDKVL